jgi:hypothetical protein
MFNIVQTWIKAVVTGGQMQVEDPGYKQLPISLKAANVNDGNLRLRICGWIWTRGLESVHTHYYVFLR